MLRVHSPAGSSSIELAAALAALFWLGFATSPARSAQSAVTAETPSPNIVSPSGQQQAQGQEQRQGQTQYVGPAENLLHTPVSGLLPGGVNTVPKLTNPAIGNPQAIERGMRYFDAFNCVGCHAANGGGGMGPALSNRFFKFGASPANIYLTILQGRSQGMPAWGSMLPSEVIWDIVAYVEQISQAPVKEWGTTTSANSPAIQQVPAEFLTTDNPWDYTEPFGKGQRPSAPAAAPTAAAGQ